MNLIDSVATLNIHQFECLENGKLMTDFTKCLVFEECNFMRLRHRIKELEAERVEQKKSKKYKQLFYFY